MSRLDLRELQILAMPGFETGGFRVAELVAGLNVITGPNGAGKTTTARAIRCLLWPEASHLKELRPALEAVAALDDRELRLSARDLQVTVSAAGAPHPPLGDPATASRYWLSLADLLANDSADLAALVARETHGGYSLAEAAKVLGANPNPRRQNAVSGFLKSTREQLRAAELADSEVAQQAQRLESLRAAQAEAAAAHRQAQQLAAALQYLPCREAARHAARALADRFDEPTRRQLACLTGNEGPALDELGRRQRQTEAAIRQARDDLRDAEQALADLGLPADGLPSLWLAQRERELAEIRQRITQAAAERDATITSLTTAREVQRRCGPAATARSLSELASPAADRVHEAVLSRLRVQAQRQAAEESLRRWQALGRPAEVAPLQQARELLESWLAAGTTAARATLAGLLLPLLLGGAGCGAGLLALAWQRPAVIWLVPGAALLLLAVVLAGPGRQRARLQRSWPATAAAAPAAWSEPQVRARLEEVRQQLAEAALAARCEPEVAARQAELAELIAAEEAGRARLAALTAGGGVAPETAEAWALILSHHLPAWLEARRHAAAHLALRRTLRREAAARLRAWWAELAAVAQPGGSTFREAEAVWADLGQRVSESARVQERIANRRLRLGELSQDLEQVVGERTALLARAGLKPDEAEGLAALVALWPTFRDLRERSDEAARQAASAAAVVDPPLRELMLDEVETQLAAAEEAAASLSRLSDEVARIEHEIRERQQSHDLAQAKAHYTAAREQLLADRARLDDAVLAHLLCETLTERQGASLPPVVREANALLAELTGRDWRLVVHPGKTPAFRLHHPTGRLDALEHLSSGHRVQVLMAVRMAFVRVQEGDGPRLPLLLDDTSAVSDDARKEAIIDAVLRFAQERQVFFCTAGSREVELWRMAADSAGVACRVTDLQPERLTVG